MDKELDNILFKYLFKIMQQGISQTFSATEVKNNFGAIIKKIQAGEYSEVIIQKHGEPVAAIVNIETLKIMKELKKGERRKELAERMSRLQDQVQSERSGDLTDEEADVIAERLSSEIIEDMEKEGKIRFEWTYFFG
mgnify:FL=1